MAVDPRTPCLIGVARRTWRQEPAPEPLAMWEELARAAAADAVSADAVRDVQSLQVVYCQSWEYDDPAGRLADLAVDLLGPDALLGRGATDAIDKGKWTRLYSFMRYSTIGGGSTEVQKNIIADRAIKLPGQARTS